MSFRCFARASALMFVLCTTACSDGDPAPSDDPLPGKVTVQVGSKGGTVKASGGMTLEIPEGALDKAIKITATNAGQSAPKEIQAKQVSDLYEFGPEGTKFNKDVKITFHTAKEEQNPVVYFTTEDGSGFEKIASQKNGKEVTAFVKHFSKGFVGVPLDEEEQPDAGDRSGDDAGEELDAGEEADAGETNAMDASTAPDASAQPGKDASAVVPDAGSQGPGDSGAEAGAPDAAVAMRHVIVHSRDLYGALVNQTWAAFQETPGGAWRPLPAPAMAGVYEFDIAASASFGVAFVCSQPDLLNSWGSIAFEPASTGMLTVVTRGPPCTVGAAPVVSYLYGDLNLDPDRYWRVGHALSTGGAGNYAGGLASYTIALHRGVVDDLLFATGPMSPFMQINRILIRRDVQIYSDTSGFNSNMDAGVAPGTTGTATALNANANTTVEVRYATRNTEDGLLLNTTDPTGTTSRVVSFATVQEGVRRPSDRYVLVATDSNSSEFRRASLRNYPSGNMNVMLPPSFVTVFASANTPYLRPTFSFTPVMGASSYMFGSVYAPQRSQARAFEISVHPGWLAGSGQQTVTFPDFSQVPGFQLAWVAPSGAGVSAKSAVLAAKSDAMGELKSESGQSATIGAVP